MGLLAQEPYNLAVLVLSAGVVLWAMRLFFEARSRANSKNDRPHGRFSAQHRRLLLLHSAMTQRRCVWLPRCLPHRVPLTRALSRAGLQTGAAARPE